MKIQTLLPIAMLTVACANESRDTNNPDAVAQTRYDDTSMMNEGPDADQTVSPEDEATFEEVEDIPTVKEQQGPDTSVHGDPYQNEPPLTEPPDNLVSPTVPGE